MKAFNFFLTIFFIVISGAIAQVPDTRGAFPIDPRLSNLKKLMRENPEKYRREFLELEKKLIKSNDQSLLVALYRLNAQNLVDSDDYDSLIRTLHQIRGLLKSKPEKESIHTYLVLGSVFFLKRDYDSLVYWQSRAENAMEPNSFFSGDYLLLKGLRSNMEGSYVDAIANLLEAEKLFEASKDRRNLAVVYNNLAINYDLLGNLDAQRDYLKKAIEINKELGYIYDLISNYNNLGISYRNQNLLDDALEYYDLAYEQLKKANYPMLLAQNLTNRGNILEKKGDLLGAESLFLECERICETNEIVYGIMLTHLNLGDLYRQMRRFELAEDRLEKGLKLSIDLSALSEQALTYERLAWLAKDLGNFEKAYNFITQYHVLNDSLISESVKKNADELKEKFEAEKKESQIIKLSNERLYQRYIILALLVAFLLLLLLVQWFRAKQSITSLKLKESEKLSQIRLETLEIRSQDLLQQTMEKVVLQEQLEGLIKKIEEQENTSQVLQNVKAIQRKQNPWDGMIEKFKLLHPNFIEKLTTRFPQLTRGDLELCSLIKMNLSTKEIAAILRITVDSVFTKKYRILKKLNLDKDSDLTTWIHSIK